MEAVESSGIVDDTIGGIIHIIRPSGFMTPGFLQLYSHNLTCCDKHIYLGGGGDEPMPSSSHSMQQMQPHDHMMMPIDDSLIMNGEFQVVGDHLMMGDQGVRFYFLIYL